MEADTSSEVLVILAIMTCFVVLPFLFKPKTNGVAANGGGDVSHAGGGDAAFDADDGGGGDGGAD
ncbi:hypothetical protein [Rhizobium sp. LjRoot258]|uniref:hypothetical protein n=1 Tax=Rhizobium sp. LjRoot258 TaxID=3342299 RepID=UPI003ED10A51